uniref:Conserved oligomeric Golgi complex subunit 3 n=1 Tax=Timema monikensis TaxID=170555 RepID=A0A7R9HUZ0_9NEOP|nr:unnamed protein product [Timema monikensis]
MSSRPTSLLSGMELKTIQNKLLRWEQPDAPLAPLSNSQRDAVLELSEEVSDLALCKDLPLGKEVSGPSEGGPHTPGLPIGFEELHQGKCQISSSQQFLEWYSAMEEELLKEEDVVFEDYASQLAERIKECAGLLQKVEVALADLSRLTEQYQIVSDSTSSLHQVSQQLLADQTRLMQVYDEVSQRLRYFTALDDLSQRLASPTLSVHSEVFVEILDRLDECMEYIHKNDSWKESSTYLVKFHHCLSRATAMVRSYVMEVINRATEQVLAQPGTPQDRDTSLTLCYGKFQASAPRVKIVVGHIENRVEKNSDYETLLSDCHQAYFSRREQLLSSSVTSAITELGRSHHGDHCSLVRSGCAFMVHMCQDEHQLFYHFFGRPTPHLVTYLERLCTILYDVLRPFIIHINHLETLAEVCSILRLEMLEEHVHNNPEKLEAFGHVAWQMLQDSQERLVFRAHCYFESDILQYRPSPGDLAYPEKLEMMESIAQSMQEQTALARSESRSSLISVGSATSLEVARINDSTRSIADQPRSRTGNSPADLHGMWYPTVRRTLVCLSRLYRCVDRPIFQGLSQEALNMCILSVASAAQTINARKTPVDGELFQIKHLLILREQIAPFQVDFTIKEMSLDFSKVKTAAFSLIHKRKRLFSLGTNNAILEFLLEGTPQVKEQLVDSRKEVDKQLKASCEAFIAYATHLLVSPILGFLEKAQVFLNMSADVKASGITLAQQPFASPSVLNVVIQETRQLIKLKLPSVQRSMQLYLANRETEFILFRPIKNNVVGAFVQLQLVLSTGGYSSDDLLLIGCPTPEQATVLLSSASLLSERQSGVENNTPAVANLQEVPAT